MIPLDAGHRTLSALVLVSLGSESTAVVQPKDIFAEALKVGADAVVIAHNHPSGDLTPSKADIAFAAALREMCDRLGNIQLLGHIIIGSPDSANGLGLVSIAEMK